MSIPVLVRRFQNRVVYGEFLVFLTDPDDPDRERELMKSVEVREDMRAMDARKRVSEILNSQAFREELEDIIETQVCLERLTNTHSLMFSKHFSDFFIVPTSSVIPQHTACLVLSGACVLIVCGLSFACWFVCIFKLAAEFLYSGTILQHSIVYQAVWFLNSDSAFHAILQTN